MDVHCWYSVITYLQLLLCVLQQMVHDTGCMSSSMALLPVAASTSRLQHKDAISSVYTTGTWLEWVNWTQPNGNCSLTVLVRRLMRCRTAGAVFAPHHPEYTKQQVRAAHRPIISSPRYFPGCFGVPEPFPVSPLLVIPGWLVQSEKPDSLQLQHYQAVAATQCNN